MSKNFGIHFDYFIDRQIYNQHITAPTKNWRSSAPQTHLW
jgi:hypothetical protein